VNVIADIFGGGSADWARAALGIRYTYLIELRDAGARGFQLPADEIRPTGVENWAGVRELAAHVLLEHGRRRRPVPAAVSAAVLPAGSTSTVARRRTPCRTSTSPAAVRRRPPLLIVALSVLLVHFLQLPR